MNIYRNYKVGFSRVILGKFIQLDFITFEWKVYGLLPQYLTTYSLVNK